ncbi:sulfite exporter TauE/SafE family protein [Clostridium fermenticellae]|uniref:Probable membrane transporter protein n=1 Tax=Clostridium fermenticellae TaxID=2068654 RepID=A0A386H2Y5_9CLOT|nr:sulfite exporter TauE/SafE family protein [Clostridium fermenticellae]AYD39938.1 sulfite exporter TauE/SafE family protein [Clostridium fermenticellae]
MIITVLYILLIGFALYFAFVFLKDYVKTSKEGKLESGNFWAIGAIGLVMNFFDTLGIGNFATETAALKNFKLTHDRTLPGTLNVANAIPVIVEALIFITVVKVEPVTLFAMLAAAVLGALIGAKFVSKLDERKVEIAMGFALLIVAVIMLCGRLNIMPSGGTAAGLTGAKLIIAVVGNFILGALMTLGIGLYAPCMALIYALGMSPKAAFPIMMASCALLMPVASAKFVKEGAYDRKASMSITVFGIVGVLIAAYIVKSLPLNILIWVVIFVVIYTAVMMLRSASRHKAK